MIYLHNDWYNYTVVYSPSETEECSSDTSAKLMYSSLDQQV